jgi:hypothetical protein
MLPLRPFSQGFFTLVASPGGRLAGKHLLGAEDALAVRSA